MADPTKPGIYLRGGLKESFDEPGKEIGDREIVMATDTGEIGTQAGWMNPAALSGTIGKIHYEYDSTDRSFGTSWADGMAWSPVEFSGGSRIMFHWHIPMRNDDSNWGGGYTEILYTYDGGSTWFSLGQSGYDTVMVYGHGAISAQNGFFVFTNCPDEDFTIQVKFRHRSYSGTLKINYDHEIQTGDHGAFWTNITLIEIRK